MGEIRVNISLGNAMDVGMAERGLIDRAKVREAGVTALVDTGSMTLVIDGLTFTQLGLREVARQRTRFANNTSEQCVISEPVEVRWNDRFCTCNAVVLPDTSEVLLGVLQLEDMDLKVDPTMKKL